MDQEDIRDVLERVSFVQALPENMRDEMLDIISEISEPVTIEEGTVLFTEGERGSDVGYFLLKGEVDVRKSNGMDSTCPAPELLGEMKQFNPVGLRTATIESLTDLELLSFDWADFRAATEDYFSPEELKSLEEVMENYAWQHFIG